MTFEDHAKIIDAAMKALHEALRDAREAAVRDLSPDALREYRRIRRHTSRLHDEMAEFGEEHVPGVVAFSGGT